METIFAIAAGIIFAAALAAIGGTLLFHLGQAIMRGFRR